MKNHITQVTLNSNKIDKEEMKTVFSQINKESILIQNGGFLFQAILDLPHLYLGIQPCIVDGLRTYHYNIKLPVNHEIVFSGCFNTDKSITLVPVMDRSLFQQGFKGDLQVKILSSYHELASFLIENGLPQNTSLDFATQHILKELHLSKKSPQTLLDLEFLSSI